MNRIHDLVPATPRRLENGSREAFERSRALLQREGFTVSWAVPPSAGRRGGRPLDLLAVNGPRIIRVIVLLDGDVDSPETRDRIRAAYRRGETRVYVRWPLSWRVLSNLARWDLRGVAVSGW
jgi:hypothetical protein